MSRKIVARYTEEQLAEQRAIWRNEGITATLASYKTELAALERQKQQLNLEQTKAVTDLLRACHENLSKAGYLIGKLNRDNSR